MKQRKTGSKTVALLVLLAPCMTAWAEFRGEVTGWNLGAADVLLASGGPPVVIGQVDEAGGVVLDLPESISPSQQVGYIFGCDGEPSVQISNREARYEITPSALLIGNFAQKKKLGYLVVADSPEVADSLFYPAGKDAIAGKSYQWMYVEEAVTIAGECTSNYLPQGSEEPIAGTTHHAMELEPGWNLVEWEVTSTFTAPDGQARSRDSEIKTIDTLPEGTVFWFVKD